MKILVAQLKPKIGDLDYNFTKVKEYYNLALKQNLDVLLLPELMTTGYLCEDLFLCSTFINDLQHYIDELAEITKNTALLLPAPIYQEQKLYNGIIAIQNGSLIGYTTKRHLPNYKIFDEKRYFEQGNPQIIEINGIKLGVPICEDLWFPDVAKELKSMGAEILLVPNASPYEKDKFSKRIEKAENCFRDNNLPIIYCNQILGQDGVVFDGRSFIYNDGIQYILKVFNEDSCVVEFIPSSNPSINITSIYNKPIIYKPESTMEDEEIYSAIILGFRDYIVNNGFKSVMLGMSGGMDSALVSVIAVDAIGASNVKLVMLPSEFTSQGSLEDAQVLAKNLSVEYQNISIVEMLKLAGNTIPNISPLAYENLQARIRGSILMTIANSTNSLLITTGNKSENAVGYTTLYGDMCGGFNPIKDIYKTDIYKLAKFRNQNVPSLISVQSQDISIIPERIFTKAPSAELSYGQKDSDSLPEYEILDQILNLHIEKNLGAKEIIAKGFDQEIVKKIVKLVKNSEFKRKQSAIGVKTSNCSFDKDRRYPVTNGYL
ncbi:MAG: NAD+ synthase [Rickettsia endosymbiont of Bryobia graminum]|nr:NAD+ synthase [Rickettsia endosymbiont of Bryobia graminum]